MSRAGQIAHSILLSIGLDDDRYDKVFRLLELIEGHLLGRGYDYKDGITYGRFTPSEVRFLKTLYERRA